MTFTRNMCIKINQKELTIKDIYDDFKLKKNFGLHGLYTDISIL